MTKAVSALVKVFGPITDDTGKMYWPKHKSAHAAWDGE